LSQTEAAGTARHTVGVILYSRQCTFQAGFIIARPETNRSLLLLAQATCEVAKLWAAGVFAALCLHGFFQNVY